MELLDRYLQTVSFWLPRRQRQDIVAELSDDIRSEIEAREHAIGHALGREEIEAILTRWGHPMLVASRYVPQRHLIGPVLLPAYRFVLTLAALCYLAPWLLVWIGLAMFDPARRTDAAVSDALRTLWVTALQAFAAITVAFAIFERSRERTWNQWHARKLFESPERNPDEIPRIESLAEVVVTGACAWWWLTLRSAPAVFDNVQGLFRVTVAALHPGLHLGILTLLAASAVLAALNLISPWWTRRRALARVGLELFGLTLAVLLLSAGPLVEITSSEVPVEKAANLRELTQWVNVSWYATIAIVAVSCLLRAVGAALRATGRRIWLPRLGVVRSS